MAHKLDIVRVHLSPLMYMYQCVSPRQFLEVVHDLPRTFRRGRRNRRVLPSLTFVYDLPAGCREKPSPSGYIQCRSVRNLDGFRGYLTDAENVKESDQEPIHGLPAFQ